MNQEKTNNNDNNYALNPVPATARVELLHTVLIRIGMVTALGQFMLGATLGHSMTFWDAMLAILLGSLLIEFISFGLGWAGMREGLPTSLLARWCGFGRIGAAFVGLFILISLMGWFGVQNSILAEGISYALEHKISHAWIATFSGITIAILVAFGFRSLSWTAKLAVPLFCLVMGWIIYLLLKDYQIAEFVSSSPPEGLPITIKQATTIVIGGMIIASLITPDLSRYCKNGKHVFWMVTSSVIVGEFIINGIAILIARILNTSEVVIIMTHSAGWIGLLAIVLSAIKVNNVNLYSSALGLANILNILTGMKWNYTRLALFLGLVGTLLSVLGILDHFVDFLAALGVLFPPVAGIMLVDYYILRTHRALLDSTRNQNRLPDTASTPAIGWPAIAAWILGSATGFTIEWGIPSINSLLVACLLYWSICTIVKKYYAQ